MSVRYRSEVVVSVPYPDIARFEAAVDRFAPLEHKGRVVEFSFASAIADKVRPISCVRVLVDSVGDDLDSDDDSESDEAREAAVEVAMRALLHVKATDLEYSASVSIVG